MSSELDELPRPPPSPSDSRRTMTPHVPAAAPEDASFGAAQGACPNCGAPVHGPYCYACGQSEKGMVRHTSEVLRDLADIVFNVDSRVFRSMFDLYFRPAFLTTEYVAGKRARYVTPFRLFFILSIIAFFAMHSALDRDSLDKAKLFTTDGISEAQTAAEVEQRVAAAIETTRGAIATVGLPDQTSDALVEAEAEIRAEGAQRIRVLEIRAAADPQQVAERVEQQVAALWQGVDKATLTDAARADLVDDENRLRKEGDRRLRRLEKSAADPDAAATDAATDHTGISINHEGQFTFNGQRWDPATMPVNVSWLPSAVNARLTATAVHMGENVRVFRDKPSAAFSAFFSVLPQTLFLLMPLFALLLKFFYIFKRRLYMEHLLVALHSHAFIFLTLIVVIVLGALKSWAIGVPWIAQPLHWLSNIAGIWMLVYLFWMQKRVYRHGWIMAAVMYSVIGISYTVLLSFGVVFAAILSLAVA